MPYKLVTFVVETKEKELQIDHLKMWAQRQMDIWNQYSNSYSIKSFSVVDVSSSESTKITWDDRGIRLVNGIPDKLR